MSLEEKNTNRAAIAKYKKIYTDWANHYLQESVLESSPKPTTTITDLQYEIQDGLLLAKIVKSVVKVDVPTVISNPVTDAQKVLNVSQCLECLTRVGIDVTEIDPKDIVEGKLKSILALFFKISRFSVHPIEEEIGTRRPLVNELIMPETSLSNYRTNSVLEHKNGRNSEISCHEDNKPKGNHVGLRPPNDSKIYCADRNYIRNPHSLEQRSNSRELNSSLICTSNTSSLLNSVAGSSNKLKAPTAYPLSSNTSLLTRRSPGNLQTGNGENSKSCRSSEDRGNSINPSPMDNECLETTDKQVLSIENDGVGPNKSPLVHEIQRTTDIEIILTVDRLNQQRNNEKEFKEITENSGLKFSNNNSGLPSKLRNPSTKPSKIATKRAAILQNVLKTGQQHQIGYGDSNNDNRKYKAVVGATMQSSINKNDTTQRINGNHEIYIPDQKNGEIISHMNSLTDNVNNLSANSFKSQPLMSRIPPPMDSKLGNTKNHASKIANQGSTVEDNTFQQITDKVAPPVFDRELIPRDNLAITGVPPVRLKPPSSSKLNTATNDDRRYVSSKHSTRNIPSRANSSCLLNNNNQSLKVSLNSKDKHKFPSKQSLKSSYTSTTSNRSVESDNKIRARKSSSSKNDRQIPKIDKIIESRNFEGATVETIPINYSRKKYIPNLQKLNGTVRGKRQRLRSCTEDDKKIVETEPKSRISEPRNPSSLEVDLKDHRHSKPITDMSHDHRKTKENSIKSIDKVTGSYRKINRFHPIVSNTSLMSTTKSQTLTPLLYPSNKSTSNSCCSLSPSTPDASRNNQSNGYGSYLAIPKPTAAVKGTAVGPPMSSLSSSNNNDFKNITRNELIVNRNKSSDSSNNLQNCNQHVFDSKKQTKLLPITPDDQSPQANQNNSLNLSIRSKSITSFAADSSNFCAGKFVMREPRNKTDDNLISPIDVNISKQQNNYRQGATPGHIPTIAMVSPMTKDDKRSTYVTEFLPHQAYHHNVNENNVIGYSHQQPNHLQEKCNLLIPNLSSASPAALKRCLQKNGASSTILRNVAVPQQSNPNLDEEVSWQDEQLARQPTGSAKIVLMLEAQRRLGLGISASPIHQTIPNHDPNRLYKKGYHFNAPLQPPTVETRTIVPKGYNNSCSSSLSKLKKMPRNIDRVQNLNDENVRDYENGIQEEGPRTKNYDIPLLPSILDRNQSNKYISQNYRYGMEDSPIKCCESERFSSGLSPLPLNPQNLSYIDKLNSVQPVTNSNPNPFDNSYRMYYSRNPPSTPSVVSFKSTPPNYLKSNPHTNFRGQDHPNLLKMHQSIFGGSRRHQGSIPMMMTMERNGGDSNSLIGTTPHKASAVMQGLNFQRYHENYVSTSGFSEHYRRRHHLFTRQQTWAASLNEEESSTSLINLNMDLNVPMPPVPPKLSRHLNSGSFLARKNSGMGDRSTTTHTNGEKTTGSVTGAGSRDPAFYSKNDDEISEKARRAFKESSADTFTDQLYQNIRHLRKESAKELPLPINSEDYHSLLPPHHPINQQSARAIQDKKELSLWSSPSSGAIKTARKEEIPIQQRQLQQTLQRKISSTVHHRDNSIPLPPIIITGGVANEMPVIGSTLSLLSNASSLYSTPEEKYTHEIFTLKKELEMAQEKVYSLSNQLSTNASVVAAFEQSLTNMTNRFKDLNATALAKDDELTYLKHTVSALMIQMESRVHSAMPSLDKTPTNDLNTSLASSNISTIPPSSIQTNPNSIEGSNCSKAALLKKNTSAATIAGKKKKNWLRSSFTKAFYRTKKQGNNSSNNSKKGNDSVANVKSSPQRSIIATREDEQTGEKEDGTSDKAFSQRSSILSSLSFSTTNNHDTASLRFKRPDEETCSLTSKTTKLNLKFITTKNEEDLSQNSRSRPLPPLPPSDRSTISSGHSSEKGRIVAAASSNLSSDFSGLSSLNNKTNTARSSGSGSSRSSELASNPTNPHLIPLALPFSEDGLVTGTDAADQTEREEIIRYLTKASPPELVIKALVERLRAKDFTITDCQLKSIASHRTVTRMREALGAMRHEIVQLKRDNERLHGILLNSALNQDEQTPVHIQTTRDESSHSIHASSKNDEKKAVVEGGTFELKDHSSIDFNKTAANLNEVIESQNPCYDHQGREMRFEQSKNCAIRYIDNLLFNLKTFTAADNLQNCPQHHLPSNEFIEPFSDLDVLTIPGANNRDGEEIARKSTHLHRFATKCVCPGVLSPGKSQTMQRKRERKGHETSFINNPRQMGKEDSLNNRAITRVAHVAPSFVHDNFSSLPRDIRLIKRSPLNNKFQKSMLVSVSSENVSARSPHNHDSVKVLVDVNLYEEFLKRDARFHVGYLNVKFDTTWDILKCCLKRIFREFCLSLQNPNNPACSEETDQGETLKISYFETCGKHHYSNGPLFQRNNHKDGMETNSCASFYNRMTSYSMNNEDEDGQESRNKVQLEICPNESSLLGFQFKSKSPLFYFNSTDCECGLRETAVAATPYIYLSQCVTLNSNAMAGEIREEEKYPIIDLLLKQSQNEMDRLCLETMIPKPFIQKYMSDLLQSGNLVIMGPPASFKSRVAISLALHLQRYGNCNYNNENFKGKTTKVAIFDLNKHITSMPPKGNVELEEFSILEYFDQFVSQSIGENDPDEQGRPPPILVIDNLNINHLSLLHKKSLKLRDWIGKWPINASSNGSYCYHDNIPYLIITINSTLSEWPQPGPTRKNVNSWEQMESLYLDYNWVMLRYDQEPLQGLLRRITFCRGLSQRTLKYFEGYLLKESFSTDSQVKPGNSGITTTINTSFDCIYYEWLAELWYMLNKILRESHGNAEISIGPKYFIEIPSTIKFDDVNDPNDYYENFKYSWNKSINHICKDILPNQKTHHFFLNAESRLKYLINETNPWTYFYTISQIENHIPKVDEIASKLDWFSDILLLNAK